MTPPAPPVTAHAPRIRELDALRGIAAVAVVLFHLTYWYDGYHVAAWPVIWGHFGVELFFIISGFVIFMTVERSRSWRDFAVSRAARLYPAYWAGVMLTAAVAYASFPRWDAAPPGLALTLVNLTMLQRFVTVAEIDNSYWTLAIELAFYVVMAAALRARLTRRIEWACCTWLVLAALARAALYLLHEQRNLGPVSSITGLFYGQFFILGMMIYRITRGERGPLTVPIMVAACLMSLFGGGPYSLHTASLPYFGVTVSLTACVLLAVTGRLRVLRWAPLVLIGEISYPLYLVHQRIGTDILRAAHDLALPAWSQTALALGLTASVALLIHYWIEVPGRAFFKRLLSGAAPTWRTRGAAMPQTLDITTDVTSSGGRHSSGAATISIPAVANAEREVLAPDLVRPGTQAR